MPEFESQVQSLHDRTLDGINQMMERSMNYVDGVEKVLVSRAVQALYPRVERRIRQAPEEDLRDELTYLHDLIENVLGKSASTSRRKKRKRKKAPLPKRGKT